MKNLQLKKSHSRFDYAVQALLNAKCNSLQTPNCFRDLLTSNLSAFKPKLKILVIMPSTIKSCRTLLPIAAKSSKNFAWSLPRPLHNSGHLSFVDDQHLTQQCPNYNIQLILIFKNLFVLKFSSE